MLTQTEIEHLYALLQERETELRSLLAYCETRRPREEGIPAILIVDDFTRSDKVTMTTAPTDQGRGASYADLAIAFAVLVEKAGGNSIYPSICPAMSAIAEWRFGETPFAEWEHTRE